MVTKKKWIQKANIKTGTLRAKLHIKKGETIPVSKLTKLLATLHKKAEKGKLSPADLKLSREVNLAKSFKKMAKRGKK